MDRVLIAGCGDVGSVLGARLAEAGHGVWGLRRDPARLPGSIRPIAADLGDPGSLAALPGTFDLVVYAAAAGRRDEGAYRAIYLDGLRNLLHALQRAGQPVRRLIQVSSTAVYGQDDGEWVDEESPAEATEFSGRILREAETLALDGPYAAVVLRAGGIYGPGRHRLIESVRGGAPCVADPPAYTNRIHRDDCAGVLFHLCGLRDPAPIYLGVDCEPAPQCATMDWLAERLGLPRPARLPGQGGRGGNKRCRNARLLASGYRFEYPTFREGYAAVLAAMQG